VEELIQLLAEMPEPNLPDLNALILRSRGLERDLLRHPKAYLVNGLRKDLAMGLIAHAKGLKTALANLNLLVLSNDESKKLMRDVLPKMQRRQTKRHALN
jgi:hypothetical protein